MRFTTFKFFFVTLRSQTITTTAMNISKAFETAFNRMAEKGWDKIYVIVDIHDTILRACYEQEETYDYLPRATSTSWRAILTDLSTTAFTSSMPTTTPRLATQLCRASTTNSTSTLASTTSLASMARPTGPRSSVWSTLTLNTTHDGHQYRCCLLCFMLNFG